MSQNSQHDLGQVLGLILGRQKMSIELHPRPPLAVPAQPAGLVGGLAAGLVACNGLGSPVPLPPLLHLLRPGRLRAQGEERTHQVPQEIHGSSVRPWVEILSVSVKEQCQPNLFINLLLTLYRVTQKNSKNLLLT